MGRGHAERERERDRQTDRRDRQTHTQRQTDRDRETLSSHLEKKKTVLKTDQEEFLIIVFILTMWVAWSLT